MENATPKFTLTLDINQVNTVLAGLGKMPFEAVSELVNVIRTQAMSQMPAPDADKKEE